MSVLLLLDAGNSRVKWGRLRDGVFTARGATDHDAWCRDDGPAPWALAGEAPPDAVIVAAVVAGDVLERLLQSLREAFGDRVFLVSVQRELAGLTAAYADLRTLGVDRWLAMLGAGRTAGYPALVVDFGTAVTMDAVAADGRHLGGAILPGRRLQRTALFTSTARIPASEDDAVAGAPFGTDTRGCVAAGVDQSIVALVERGRAALNAHEAGVATIATAGARAATKPAAGAWSMGEQADPADPAASAASADAADPAASAVFSTPGVPLLVTGGDASAMGPLLPADARFEPDLVLLGLARWWEARTAGEGAAEVHP